MIHDTCTIQTESNQSDAQTYQNARKQSNGERIGTGIIVAKRWILIIIALLVLTIQLQLNAF